MLEEAAAVVRMVFEMYANGHSIVQICEYLNSKGLRLLGGKFQKEFFV